MADKHFDINNFVIDRIVRGVALSQKDDSVLFSINQIQNASLNCASESTDAVDAMGTPIATFYRAKTAEFSAENALFDMNLMATQLGMEDGKHVAGDNVAKVVVPAMESFTVAEGGKYTLKHKALSAPSEIYAINEDSTFGVKYDNAAKNENTAPSEKEFVYTELDNVITLPTDEDLKVGTEMFVMYEYESESAVEVVNSAKNFPVGCKFIMEVLGCDVCDQTNL